MFITEHQTVTAGTKASPYKLSEASAACCVFELESGLNSSKAVQQEQYLVVFTSLKLFMQVHLLL